MEKADIGLIGLGFSKLTDIAPRGAPTEKGAVALSHFGFVRQLLFSLLQYAKDLKERRTANCGLRTASYPYCFLIGIML